MGGGGVSQQEFKRALGYANLAMELLKRGKVPPYPQFYELLYTYSTGVNPSLNQRVNEIFRGTLPDDGVAEILYNEFIKSQTAGERISDVTERMSQRIEAMHMAIDNAVDRAAAYSDELAEAAEELGDPADNSSLRALAARLLSETRQMQEANASLEQQLGASRDDIASLQRDLDEVRRESMLDPLTKIANRKSFDEGLLREVASAQNAGTPLCLMLIDIDDFKRFNDTWGHQTGDQVLRLVAMTLRSNIKGQDVAARYGGEEFAAILPATDLAGAVTVAENVRKAIQSKALLKRSTNERLGRITASFGVAMLRGEDSPGTLIERADRCLYAAKHGGRNRVFSQQQLGQAA